MTFKLKCHTFKLLFLILWIKDSSSKYLIFKYLMRSPIQNGDNLSRILLFWSLILYDCVFNASSLELLFRPPIHLFCVTPLQRPGNPCSFSSSCVIFNRCGRNVKEQNEKSKGHHVIILCHPPLYRQKIEISFSWDHLHISLPGTSAALHSYKSIWK